MEPGSQLTSALNKIRIQVSKKIEAQVCAHTHTKEKAEEKRNGIYMIGRKSKMVKIIYENKTLI